MTFHPNEQLQEPITADGPTFCAVHPTVETTLRCNKCGRYMCTKCVVRTPVGYRCKQCVHQQQDVYFTASQRDYIVAAAVSFALSIPVSFIVPRLFLFGVIILSLPAGALIAEAVHRAVGRRRGRYTWIVVMAGIVAGAVVAQFALIRAIFMELSFGGMDTSIVFALLVPLIYVVLCAGAAAARLRYGN